MQTTNQLRLPIGVDLRAGLVTAFRVMIGYATEQARQPPHTGKHLHEFRRSIRRARALVELCRPVLHQADARSLQRQLRLALDATSALRDLDVLPRTLAKLELSKKLRKDAAEYLVLLEQRRLDARGSRAPALISGARRIGVLPAELDRMLPAEISWAELEEGLARTYRRARRERKAASSAEWIEATHSWRKRTKEVSYQLELLTTDLSKKHRKLHTRYERVARRLGRVTDLLVLAEDVRATRKGGPRPKRLARSIAMEAESRADELIDKTAKRYATKPKAFAAAAIDEIRAARSAISLARVEAD